MYQVNSKLDHPPGKPPDNFFERANAPPPEHKESAKSRPLLKEYSSVFKEQLESGPIGVVPESVLMNEEAHFKPHHPVIKRDRDTTKCGVVFDGAAKSPGKIHP